MADRVTAKLVGGPELSRYLKQIDPSRNRNITDGALVESMLLALRFAARKHIHAGGKGPPRKDKLTSRTGGGGGLVGSLAPNIALDKTGLIRRFIEGGSRLVYAAIHEFGGDITQRRTRKLPGGGLRRRSFTFHIDARPYLAPGLADAETKFADIMEKHWAREIAR